METGEIITLLAGWIFKDLYWFENKNVSKLQMVWLFKALILGTARPPWVFDLICKFTAFLVRCFPQNSAFNLVSSKLSSLIGDQHDKHKT